MWYHPGPGAFFDFPLSAKSRHFLLDVDRQTAGN
jgi:hypothetical protein